MSKNDFNLKKWVNERIATLEIEAKHSKFKDKFWVWFLLSINVITIIAAIFALTFLFLRTPSQDLNFSGNLSLIFTITSLVFTISSFFLQIINKIYVAKMRDKIYRISIQKLKIEIIKYQYRIGVYKQGNPDLTLEAAVNKVNADILTFQSIKPKMRQAFITTATGGKA